MARVVVDNRLPPHLRSAGGRHHGAHESPGHMRVSQILLCSGVCQQRDDG